MLMPSVSRFMTREPYAITSTTTLDRARALMQEHHIRHLPVIDGAELVGVISRSDVRAVESIPGVALDHVEVARLMAKPLCVQGEAPLDEVSELMAKHKADCTVVLGPRGVQGIFTAIDALHALGEVLQRATA